MRERFDAEQDRCTDKIGDKKSYTLASKSFPYDHRRQLPKDLAEEAISYIRALTQRYPFQLRYHMALPFWYRFTEEWCDSGDREKSLRAI